MWSISAFFSQRKYAENLKWILTENDQGAERGADFTEFHGVITTIYLLKFRAFWLYSVECIGKGQLIHIGPCGHFDGPIQGIGHESL
jgi:hypothetical protein